MSRYRKRPIEVDAVQWLGDNEAAMQKFTGPENFHVLRPTDGSRYVPKATAKVYDKLHSTWVLVFTGQYVIRGVQGEYYPIAADVLAETYELVVA